MGYEEQVPPLPTRAQQVKMLENLEESWLKQPFYRFYMQESLRKKKMQHGSHRNFMWLQWLNKFAFYGILMLPVALWVGKFTRYTPSKVPAHFKPFFWMKHRDMSQVRNWNALKLQSVVWTTLTVFLTELNMDYRDMLDENYDDAKDYRML